MPRPVKFIGTSGVGVVLLYHMADQVDGRLYQYAGTKPGDMLEFYNYAPICSKIRYLLSIWRDDSPTVFHTKFRKVYAARNYILHYHGGHHKAEDRAGYERKAKHIIVATKDMLGYKYAREAEYIPDPIDTKHFRPWDLDRRPRALLRLLPKFDVDKIFSIIAESEYKDMDIDIMGSGPEGSKVRPTVPVTSYALLPKLLSKYEVVLDVRHFNDIFGIGYTLPYDSDEPVFSNTGLQALSCGCKVLASNGQSYHTMPSEHEPKNVIPKVLKAYAPLWE